MMRTQTRFYRDMTCKTSYQHHLHHNYMMLSDKMRNRVDIESPECVQFRRNTRHVRKYEDSPPEGDFSDTSGS